MYMKKENISSNIIMLGVCLKRREGEAIGVVTVIFQDVTCFDLMSLSGLPLTRLQSIIRLVGVACCVSI